MMETEYWIIIDEQPSGPYTRSQLEQMSGLTSDTMVWYEALTDWIPMSQVAALQDLRESPASSYETEYMPPIPADEIPAIPQEPACPPVDMSAMPESAGAAYCAASADNTVVEGVCMPRRPGNYLAWAIVSIVLFLPTGIVALLYSLSVNKRYKRGDYEGSQSKSERAQWWIIISIVLGLMFYPIRALTIGY